MLERVPNSSGIRHSFSAEKYHYCPFSIYLSHNWNLNSWDKAYVEVTSYIGSSRDGEV